MRGWNNRGLDIVIIINRGGGGGIIGGVGWA